MKRLREWLRRRCISWLGLEMPAGVQAAALDAVSLAVRASADAALCMARMDLVEMELPPLRAALADGSALRREIAQADRKTLETLSQVEQLEARVEDQQQLITGQRRDYESIERAIAQRGGS